MEGFQSNVQEVMFTANFGCFASEAKRAFPEMKEVLDRSEKRLSDAQQEEVTQFQKDMGTSDCSDEDLLERAKKSGLLQGFEIPQDAVAENRARTIDWLRAMLHQPANVPGLSELMGGGDLASLAGLASLVGGPEGGIMDMNIIGMLKSKEGQELTKEIGRSMGVDIDLSSPEVVQAFGMIDKIFNCP